MTCFIVLLPNIKVNEFVIRYCHKSRSNLFAKIFSRVIKLHFPFHVTELPHLHSYLGYCSSNSLCRLEYSELPRFNECTQLPFRKENSQKSFSVDPVARAISLSLHSTPLIEVSLINELNLLAGSSWFYPLIFSEGHLISIILLFDVLSPSIAGFCVDLVMENSVLWVS